MSETTDTGAAEAAGRTGRRAGDSTTRDDILAAARKLFSSNGFKDTTLRAVAVDAGVDVALIPYYFGNKRGLFIEALQFPVDPTKVISQAAVGPPESLGIRLVTAFTGVWEDAATGPALRALFRTAVTDEATAAAFGGFASHEMLPLVAEQGGISLAAARIGASTLFGLTMMRYLIEAPAFTDPSRDEVIATYGPALQRIIDADRAASD